MQGESPLTVPFSVSRGMLDMLTTDRTGAIEGAMIGFPSDLDAHVLDFGTYVFSVTLSFAASDQMCYVSFSFAAGDSIMTSDDVRRQVEDNFAAFKALL